MLERVWRKGNPLTLLVGMQTSIATLETVWRFLKRLEWVAISFSNAWKLKMKVKSLSHLQLLGTPMDCSLPGSSIHVEIPLKAGNRTAIWPSNPTAGHTHWGNQNWQRHMYPNVHHSTVYNSQDMEAAWMSISRQMDKKAVVHIHNGVLFSH